MSSNPNARHQPPRSFVRRQGRLTDAQRRALQTHRELLIDERGAGPLCAQTLFGRAAPLWVEIGFGNGATLVHLAARLPDHDFIGIEVHTPGIGRLLLAIAEQQLGNIRIANADAREFVAQRLADASVSRMLILFPDPWPKKRHHKRRLVQPAFAQILARKLVPGGVLHLATDWEDYAEQMLAVLEDVADLRNQSGPGRFAQPPDYRIPTRFEVRGLREGNAVHDLLFERAA